MLLAQNRYWRWSLSKGRDAIVLALDRDQLPEDLHEVRDLRIEVPLGRWNTVVKLADSDRKLLGGVLLDYATHKDHVSSVIASDRLLAALQRLIRDATVASIEAGILVLTPAAAEEG
jgi:hypothetical protein